MYRTHGSLHLIVGMALALTILVAPAASAQSVSGKGSFRDVFIGTTAQLSVDAHLNRHGVPTGHMFYTYLTAGGYVTVDLPVDLLIVNGHQAMVGSGTWYFIIVDNGSRRTDPPDQISTWYAPDSFQPVDGNFTVRP